MLKLTLPWSFKSCVLVWFYRSDKSVCSSVDNEGDIGDAEIGRLLVFVLKKLVSHHQ